MNAKKLRRLMREHDLQPKQRRRYVVTTDSDHAGPVYPDLAKAIVPDRPNQLWVADLTYVAIPGGFGLPGCHPGFLVAQGRRLCDQPLHGCTHRRRGVECPIRNQQPPKGCIHHSDRESQYASEVYRALLAAHGLAGVAGATPTTTPKRKAS